MSTPIEILIAQATMRCAKCDSSTGCGCWTRCGCGWNREVGFACGNSECSRSMPQLTKDEWVLLLEVWEGPDDGYRPDPPRRSEVTRLLAEGLVHRRRWNRFTASEHGRECVATCIRHCDEEDERERRASRAAARRSLRKLSQAK